MTAANLPAPRDDRQPAQARIIAFPNTTTTGPIDDILDTNIEIAQITKQFVHDLTNAVVRRAQQCPIDGCGANIAGWPQQQFAVHMSKHGLLEQVKARLRGWKW